MLLAREQDAAIVAEVLQALAVVAPDADVPQVYASLSRPVPVIMSSDVNFSLR